MQIRADVKYFFKNKKKGLKSIHRPFTDLAS